MMWVLKDPINICDWSMKIRESCFFFFLGKWFNYMCMCIIVFALTGILDQNMQCYDSCICRQLACSVAYLRAVGGL